VGGRGSGAVEYAAVQDSGSAKKKLDLECCIFVQGGGVVEVSVFGYHFGLDRWICEPSKSMI
jgi:hypothetical protein